VGDEEVGQAELALQVLEQVDDLRLHDTSSAETGSSQTMSFGLERERAGDADALALAAGELVRVAVGRRSGGRPDPRRAARARARVGGGALGDAGGSQRLGRRSRRPSCAG
jgi:hypothetical protein